MLAKEAPLRRAKRDGHRACLHRHGPRRTDRLFAVLAAMALGCGCASPAAAQLVRLTKLKNANFGTISNFTTDSIRSQNVCVYSSNLDGGYTITATGSGAGGAFTLAGSGALLPYEVQWNSASGQTLGTSLSPGNTLPGLTSDALSSTCKFGPATTASLIIIIRANEASSATATSYSGTLTLVVTPE